MTMTLNRVFPDPEFVCYSVVIAINVFSQWVLSLQVCNAITIALGIVYSNLKFDPSDRRFVLFTVIVIFLCGVSPCVCTLMVYALVVFIHVIIACGL